MKNLPCVRSWEIDARREGRLDASARESSDRHLHLCADCRTQMERDEQLRRLARRLPDRAPSPLVLRRLQARLLRDVAVGVPARPWNQGRRWMLAALVGALGMGAWLLVGAHFAPLRALGADGPAATIGAPRTAPSGPSPEALAGVVVASSSARWSQTREQRVERVKLDEGAIRVHVRPQANGERFLVILPDGEIEVRGTTFDVSVEHGTTARVSVDEGVVDLRLRDRAPRRLTAHEAWNAAAPTPPALDTAPKPAPVVHRPSASPPIGAPSAPEADHHGDYARAVELLRDGQYDQAASAFHALGLEQAAPEADDSSFLEAVALARAGRADAAALVAERHLAAFPSSFHRKEASILVARAASRRGDCTKARAVMAPWMGDSSTPGVYTALGSCESTPR